MKYREDFCIFILSANRPDKNYTWNTVKKYNYSGKVYVVVGTDDKQLERYKEVYKDNLIIFDKEDYKGKFDKMDNFDNKNYVVYPRNACFDIAKKMKFKYFIAFDDDYTAFSYKFLKNLEYKHNSIKQYDIGILEFIFDEMIKLLETNENILTVAMAQCGDFMGGKEGVFASKIFLKRKAMNSFLCKTERKFEFIGSFNEDVNMYLHYGSLGKLAFTFNIIALSQQSTQKTKGGLTEVYLEQGTFVKSFYSVMLNPSAVKIMTLGITDKRIHHKILWKYVTPKLLDPKYKK